MAKKVVLTLGLALVALATVAAVGAPAGQKKTHLGDRARSLVAFYARVDANSSAPLQLVGRDGILVEDFTLPEKTVLVVTDVIVTKRGDEATRVRAGLINGGLTDTVHPFIEFWNPTPQGAVHLTSGAVWSEIPRAFTFDDSASAYFHVYGYLVKDK